LRWAAGEDSAGRAEEAASPRAEALAATPATAPPANATWTACAAEGGVCTVPGSVTVRYGANGAYFYATVTGSVACSNGQWGDPLFGVVKACAYTSASSTPTAAPSAGSWVTCANEGGVCTVSGTSNVRYGANGSYFYKTVSGSIACGNGAWGDPLFGIVKSCAYDSGGTVASPPTPTTPTAPTTPSLGTAALQWNAATDPRVVAYRVYWGTARGNYQQARGSGLTAGTATAYTVRDLPAGRTYYFAVTAQDSSGVESDFSAEASKAIP
jgi:hypothetical protein